MKSVRIVGAGLIGTSIGLGLAAQGYAIRMVDADSKRELLAQDLVGKPEDSAASVVVFALPTSSLSLVMSQEYAANPNAIFIDVGSTKTKPQREIESISGLSARFCGTHPMAGREFGGPESARADLFEGRAWIYTPGDAVEEEVVNSVVSLIESLGAIPIRMGVGDHDAAVALISHLPQISASLLASQLIGAPAEWLTLAGQGLRDSTRIAASDPQLWTEIISLNRSQILPLLWRLREDLDGLISNLNLNQFVEKSLKNGNLGRASIPGKHGGRNRDYFFLPIVIEDKPGQLALLFQECADAGVNIEDLSIEHSPGQFTGLITLALSEKDSLKLTDHLGARGWKVHGL
ncbi:MAG: prephenate dehydrogenase [Actinobacteria bacterium]|nr:prephenate dehydrogenase [Actinomycetota bacterium]